MEKLRVQLEFVNQKILQLFFERRELVKAIIAQKCSRGVYDPQREWEVFRRHKDLLQRMEWMEVLSFSLLMEAQAYGQDEQYPQWHLGIHLEREHEEQLLPIIHQINPLLLKTIHSGRFAQLPLRAKFTKLFERATVGAK